MPGQLKHIEPPPQFGCEDLRTASPPLAFWCWPTGTTSGDVHKPTKLHRTSILRLAQKAKNAYLGDRLASLSGYPARFCHGMVNLRLGLGMSEAALLSVPNGFHEGKTDAEVDVSSAQNGLRTGLLTVLDCKTSCTWSAKVLKSNGYSSFFCRS